MICPSYYIICVVIRFVGKFEGKTIDKVYVDLLTNVPDLVLASVSLKPGREAKIKTGLSGLSSSRVIYAWYAIETGKTLFYFKSLFLLLFYSWEIIYRTFKFTLIPLPCCLGVTICA